MGQLCMLFRYLASVGLVTCLIIACALPFVVAAVWQTRARKWRMLWLIGVLLLVQTAVISLPPIEGLGHLHWHWQECLLSIAWPLLLVRFVPTVSLNSIGVTSHCAVDRHGGAGGIFCPWFEIQIDHRRLALPIHDAGPRRGVGIPWSISVLVESRVSQIEEGSGQGEIGL
jgi:hypothetical protein